MNLTKILSETYEAYRRGRIELSQNRPISNPISFDNLLQERINSKLALPDRLLLRKCSRLHKLSLISARNRKINTAKELLDESHNVFISSEMSPQAKLLAKTFYESVLAYLNYCEDLFDLSRSSLFRALEIDSHLENDFGYKILLMHKIQLIHNLMRIERKCKNYDIYFNISNNIIKFLEGDHTSWPLSGFNSGPIIDKVPSDLINIMTVQIINDVAMTINDLSSSTSELFSFLACHTKHKDNLCNVFPHIHEWMSIKQYFLNNDYIGFLSNVSHFLRFQSKDLPYLWNVTVFDLQEICSQIDTHESRLIQKTLTEDIEHTIMTIK